MKRPSKYTRHDARKYETRRNYKWIDRRGEKIGRLLYIDWVGRWRGRSYWKCLCDCGKECVRRYRPNNTTSCGCANDEANKKRVWTTLREDGTWRHGLARKIALPDGRVFASIQAMADIVGCGRDAMGKRIQNWPPERWLEIAHPRGKGAEKHRAAWIRSKRHKSLRPQPWASLTYKEINRKKREWQNE